MVKNWRDIEQFLKSAKVYYEIKDWLYLCFLETGQFYYSPQTGKWKMKGKRAWQASQSPQDFLNQASHYSGATQQVGQPRNHPPKNNQKTSGRKDKTIPKEQKRDNSANSANRKVDSESFKGIRPEFLEEFGRCLQEQRKFGYNIGWVCYTLIEQRNLTPVEICWLCVIFKYSRSWAVSQIQKLAIEMNRELIFAIIDKNQTDWLRDFEKRWGRENPSRDKTQKAKDQVNPYAQQNASYKNYLDILEIRFPFTKEDLKQAYKKRALATHPDCGGTSEDFRLVHTAYQVLLQNHKD